MRVDLADRPLIPCDHYTAATDTMCRATPTKLYLPGVRCADHTPAKLNAQRAKEMT